MEHIYNSDRILETLQQGFSKFFTLFLFYPLILFKKTYNPPQKNMIRIHFFQSINLLSTFNIFKLSSQYLLLFFINLFYQSDLISKVFNNPFDLDHIKSSMFMLNSDLEIK